MPIACLVVDPFGPVRLQPSAWSPCLSKRFLFNHEVSQQEQHSPYCVSSVLLPFLPLSRLAPTDSPAPPPNIVEHFLTPPRPFPCNTYLKSLLLLGPESCPTWTTPPYVTVPATSAQSVGSCTAVHTVVSGEWLSKIADTYGVSVSDILASNSAIKNPDLISPGQAIKIPPCTGENSLLGPVSAVSRLSCRRVWIELYSASTILVCLIVLFFIIGRASRHIWHAQPVAASHQLPPRNHHLLQLTPAAKLLAARYGHFALYQLQVPHS